MGPHPVIIFCFGNLEYIPLQVLRDISSSGIFLLMPLSVLGGEQVAKLVSDWSYHKPTTILLISGEETWYNEFMRDCTEGARILRAFPDPQPPLRTPGTSTSKEWVWDYLLKEKGRGAPVEIESMLLWYAPKFLCRLCYKATISVEHFFSHLKSREHKQKALRQIGTDEEEMQCIQEKAQAAHAKDISLAVCGVGAAVTVSGGIKVN
ncbi:uncharacterized protein LOC112082907 [Eutrema salsugineum]|uniref:uncharacterized protein LOC112082907 n=1 Tax=Eutrema salsugineum TaxID=72664 RepID=UPI000CED6C9B|nr:uncharacterized protein LOC112082907 [Eutrema salsugineum]